MLQAKTQKLAERRVSMGWTKADLARNANLRHSSVVRAEQGRGVSPKSAKAICDALGENVTDLFSVYLRKGV